MTRDVALSRRVVCGGALAAALGGDTAGGGIARRLTAAATVLIATDEPWATYHVAPLLAEAARRGMRLIQLVPDCSRIAPGDPVPVATPAHAPPADLLVVAGAGDWPADCAAGFPRIPVAASSFAYQPPVEARRAGEIRRRLRLITSSSRVEGLAFGARLGVDGVVRVVGSAQADALPHRVPQHGLVLVLTSVTDQDSTGSAAPGTELLLAATDKLAAAGNGSWTVPPYLLEVCSSTIVDEADAVAAVDSAHLPDPATSADAVGPIGGSARRLLDEWSAVSS